MIDVKMYGEIWKTKDNNGFKLACYSCWKPNVEGVDFYVNDMLEDSIRYNDGLCYHKRNLCRPETCTCLSRGKSFTWNYTSDLSYIQFSCEMRFKDLSQSTIIGYKTDLIYNGSGNYLHKHRIKETKNKRERERGEYIPCCTSNLNMLKKFIYLYFDVRNIYTNIKQIK